MVSKESAISLYIQIQDVLFEQIRQGVLQPGSQVPSEQELATTFSVSRMTARKALDGLINKGLLYRQQGKGTFVANDVMTYGLSTMLSFSRTLQARGHTVTTRVLNQEVIPASPTVIGKLNLRSGSDVVLIRRLRIVDGKPIAIHSSFMDHRLYAPILQADLSTASLIETIERLCGVRVAYSKDTVQAAVVNVEDAPLLDIAAGSPVLEVDGVTYTENGQPTRYNRAVYRGDCVRLGVTNTSSQATLYNIT